MSGRSIANTLTPLRLVLSPAVASGLIETNDADTIVLPCRRGGRPWDPKEAHFLTREELTRLLEQIPASWRPLFDLLVATGLRISEGIALRWSDLRLDTGSPRWQVRRTIVRGAVGAPKSRHGARMVPLPPHVAATAAFSASAGDVR